MIGIYHQQKKWSVVAEWSSMIFEIVEKEVSQDYAEMRERILLLLANAYLLNSPLFLLNHYLDISI